MKIHEFDDVIKIGDIVMILDGHGSKAEPKCKSKYTFAGYTGNCELCPGCKGYVKLIREDGKVFQDCYRSNFQKTIRLKIITPKFLPDNLFEF